MTRDVELVGGTAHKLAGMVLASGALDVATTTRSPHRRVSLPSDSSFGANAEIFEGFHRRRPLGPEARAHSGSDWSRQCRLMGRHCRKMHTIVRQFPLPVTGHGAGPSQMGDMAPGNQISV